MKRRPLIVVAAVSVLGIGLSAAVASVLVQRGARTQDTSRRMPEKRIVASKKAMQQWSPVPQPWQLAGPDPSQVYQVDPMPVRGDVKERTPQQERLLKDAAAIFSRLRPIPVERIRFFSWMNAEDSRVVFAGWGGFVEQVTPMPQGWLITFHVTPFATLKSRGPALINNIFVEEYVWANGNLQFVRGYAHPRIGSEPSITLM